MPTPEQIDNLLVGFAIGFPVFYCIMVELG